MWFGEQFGCGLCFGLCGVFPGGQLGCEFKDLGFAVLNLIWCVHVARMAALEIALAPLEIALAPCTGQPRGSGGVWPRCHRSPWATSAHGSSSASSRALARECLGAKRAFNEHSQKGSEDRKRFWNKGFYKGKYIEMVSTDKILVLMYCEERWLLWHFSPFYCKEGKERF